MIIRCERCSTIYELDEALLAPEGSPVQCTRCKAIFSARPPRPAAHAHAHAQAPAPGGVSAEPTAVEFADQGPLPLPPSQPPSAAVAEPPPAAAPAQPPQVAAPVAPPPPPPRGARPGPAIYRRPPPAVHSPATAQAGARSASGRRGTVGAFEARFQRSTLWRRLLVPAAALLLVALVAGGTALWRRRPDPEVLRLAAEAAARLTQDDTGSLTRAVQLYDTILARAPSRLDAAADRALARLLLAAAKLEEAEPFAEQLARRAAERERLMGGPPAGVEDVLRLLAVEATRLEGELAPRRQEAERLTAQAASELKAVAAGPGGEALAARGLAVAAALASERDETTRQAALARTRGADRWADLAEAWLALRTSGGREPALAALARLAAEHPDLLRARYLLARAQVAGGRKEEAVATLARLLAANPRHERAQRLKGALTAPPPPPPAPPPAPPAPVQRRTWVTPTPVAAPVASPAAPAAPVEPPTADQPQRLEPTGEPPLPPPIRIVLPPAGAPARRPDPAPEPGSPDGG